MAAATALAPHPLHTTLAVFTVRADGSIAISVRAFADDFGASVRVHAGDRTTTPALPAESAIESYARSAIRLSNGAGQPITLTWCGVRHEGDLVWVCLAAPAKTGFGEMRLRDSLLVERFDDQVNIVQVLRATHRTTVLFTKRDGVKALSD